MINVRSILFIGDGPSEARSLKEKFCKIYHCFPDLRTVSCNGKDVSPDGYANKSLGIFLMALSSHYRYILCIVDKEKRKVSASIFTEQLKESIMRKILSCSRFSRDELELKIKVCVPNRMFENWILADVKGIKTKRDLIKPEARQVNYEGRHGEKCLNSIMHVKYKKSAHSHVLFKLVAFNRAKENSSSFFHFNQCLKLCI